MSSYENSPVVVQAGRKLILAAAILMGISVLLGLIGARLTLGQFSTAEFTRDVVINGAQNPKVPGKLSFKVIEPLQATSAADAAMRIGVAADYTDLQPVCKIANSAGVDVPLKIPVSGETIIRDTSRNFSVLGVAILVPGEYEALCTINGEPGSASGSFTVGRVFGMDDLTGSFAPILWFLAVGLFCGLMFLVGSILMIVGLVQRSKGKKSGPSTQSVPGSGVGSGTLTGPGEYGQVPPAREPVPPWPSPHPPGPPEAAFDPPLPPAPPLGPPTAAGAPPTSAAPTGPPTAASPSSATSPAAPPAPEPPSPEPPPGWTVPPSKLR